MWKTEKSELMVYGFDDYTAKKRVTLVILEKGKCIIITAAVKKIRNYFFVVVSLYIFSFSSIFLLFYFFLHF